MWCCHFHSVWSTVKAHSFWAWKSKTKQQVQVGFSYFINLLYSPRYWVEKKNSDISLYNIKKTKYNMAVPLFKRKSCFSSLGSLYSSLTWVFIVRNLALLNFFPSNSHFNIFTLQFILTYILPNPNKNKLEEYKEHIILQPAYVLNKIMNMFHIHKCFLHYKSII